MSWLGWVGVQWRYEWRWGDGRNVVSTALNDMIDVGDDETGREGGGIDVHTRLFLSVTQSLFVPVANLRRLVAVVADAIRRKRGGGKRERWDGQTMAGR